MLDELCPIQFIEGVNENEELHFEELFQIKKYIRVAIQLVPVSTFLLSKIEIYIVWERIGVAENYNVNLHSDYKDNPTDIVLTDGKLSFNTTDRSHGWRNIDLNQPVVVVSEKHYWLDLESRDALFALGVAKDGDGVAVRAMVNDIWSAGNNRLQRPMLRFYGRVLPVVS